MGRVREKKGRERAGGEGEKRGSSISLCESGRMINVLPSGRRCCSKRGPKMKHLGSSFGVDLDIVS